MIILSALMEISWGLKVIIKLVMELIWDWLLVITWAVQHKTTVLEIEDSSKLTIIIIMFLRILRCKIVDNRCWTSNNIDRRRY